MPIIEWDEAYCIGNTDIDTQHKELIAYYNAAHERMLSGQDSRPIGINTLVRLIDYCRYHFAFEEAFMETENYPDLARHKELHNAFYSKVCRNMAALEQGDFVMASEILKLAENWILDHILNQDRKITAFLE